MRFRVESSREIFQGRYIRLVNKKVRLPTGRRTTVNVVEHPGAVAIVPVFENGDVALIRQFRPSIGRELFEIPAGTLEPGEPPLATAKREIVEETGYRARSWKKIAEFYTAPGFCTELMHVYVARGLSRGEAEADEDEIIRTMKVPLRTALGFVRRGKVRDAKSIVGLLVYGNGHRG